MGNKLWKQVERDVAELFGCRRKIGSGCDITRDGGDIDHATCHVEVKERKAYEVLRWFFKAEELAAGEIVESKTPGITTEKFPVLVIRQKAIKRLFVVAPLDLAYLERLVAELRAAAPRSSGGPIEGI